MTSNFIKDNLHQYTPQKNTREYTEAIDMNTIEYIWKGIQEMKLETIHAF